MQRLYLAKIRIHCNEDIYETIRRSLIAEIKSPANVGRVSMDMSSVESNTIEIVVKADSFSHLRAIINSILYLLYAITSSIEVVVEYGDKS